MHHQKSINATLQHGNYKSNSLQFFT